jgi:hypothetical protein
VRDVSFPADFNSSSLFVSCSSDKTVWPSQQSYVAPSACHALMATKAIHPHQVTRYAKVLADDIVSLQLRIWEKARPTLSRLVLKGHADVVSPPLSRAPPSTVFFVRSLFIAIGKR